VPSKIYVYTLNDVNNLTSGWILGNESALNTGSPFYNGFTMALKSMLAIVASEDDTNVEVYDLTTSNRISQGNLNGMEKLLVLLDNGTHFKVVSDKMVSVLLLNYQQNPPDNVQEGPLPHTFYTSINGLYVDKEFVLMASEQTALVPNTFFTLLAVERSTVTVTDEGGSQNSYVLDANSYKYIMLEPFRVYRIESTGNIMVQSGVVLSALGGVNYRNSYPVPSAEGGFVGKFFFARSNRGWSATTDYGYLALASEDANVKVFDLDSKEVIKEFLVQGGSGVWFKPSANTVAVQSDKPITLTFTNNGSIQQNPIKYGVGVMFIGIEPNQDTLIYLPISAYVEAYFFASETTQLTIDGYTQTVHADSSLLYNLPGVHTVNSDANVVLQVNFWSNEPEYQGIWFTGAAIPSIEMVNAVPDVTLTPIEGFPMIYVVVGAAVAGVAAIVGILVMRRRSSKPN
jgi:WD40 repeat protein